MRQSLSLIATIFFCNLLLAQNAAEILPTRPNQDEKLQQAEALADRFLERLHQTWDVNALFKDMAVSDFASRHRTGSYHPFAFGVTVCSPIAKELMSSSDDVLLLQKYAVESDVWYMLLTIAFSDVRDFSKLDKRISKDVGSFALLLPTHVRAIARQTKYFRWLVEPTACDSKIRRIVTQQDLNQFINEGKRLSTELREIVRGRDLTSNHYKEMVSKLWQAADVTEKDLSATMDGWPSLGVGEDTKIYCVFREIFYIVVMFEDGQPKLLHVGCIGEAAD